MLSVFLLCLRSILENWRHRSYPQFTLFCGPTGGSIALKCYQLVSVAQLFLVFSATEASNIKSKNANQNQINTTTGSKREMMEEEVQILKKVKPSIADLISSPERLTHTPSSELISLASKTTLHNIKSQFYQLKRCVLQSPCHQLRRSLLHKEKRKPFKKEEKC